MELEPKNCLRTDDHEPHVIWQGKNFQCPGKNSSGTDVRLDVFGTVVKHED